MSIACFVDVFEAIKQLTENKPRKFLTYRSFIAYVFPQ